MAKIENDKYYTPRDLAEYCVNKTKEIIGENNITEYLEPSGGNGAFLDFLPVGTYSCDILPEDPRIVKQDFLTLDIPYKKGRCVIGNPPFGKKSTLARIFYKKSITLGDYIAFILPINQLKNNQHLYEFDLIYSEDLGLYNYSNVELVCCFNIYKRNKRGLNKTPQKLKIKGLELTNYLRGRGLDKYDEKTFKFDYGICAWGGSIGKEITLIGKYAYELFFIFSDNQLKEKCLPILKNTDWLSLCKSISSPKIQQWRVLKYLQEQLGIENYTEKDKTNELFVI